MFTTLWANLADDKFMLFLFLPENGIWHFMQIVSIGNNSHIMSNSVSREKCEMYFKTSSAESFTKSAKRKYITYWDLLIIPTV